MIKTKEVLAIVVVATIFTMVVVGHWGVFSFERDSKEKIVTSNHLPKSNSKDIAFEADKEVISNSKKPSSLIYTKEEELITDPETGTIYAIGRLVISTAKATSFEETTKLVASLGGEVIGYNEYLRIYQIRFPGILFSELQEKAQELKESPLVTGVKMNLGISPPQTYDDNY